MSVGSSIFPQCDTYACDQGPGESDVSDDQPVMGSLDRGDSDTNDLSLLSPGHGPTASPQPPP